jgi:exonuclease VII small subunit
VKVKPLTGPALDLFEKVVLGLRDYMEYSSIPPWVLSHFFIEDLKQALEEPGSLKGDAVVNVLVMASHVDYSELMTDWYRLSIEERGMVVSRIVKAMAVMGLTSLLGSMATYLDPREKEEIMRVAMKYYEGKISYDEMVSEIENIIWPTEEEKNLDWNHVENYRKGMSLAKYLPKELVRKMVGVYLIKWIRLQQTDGLWVLPSVYPRFSE